MQRRRKNDQFQEDCEHCGNVGVCDIGDCGGGGSDSTPVTQPVVQPLPLPPPPSAEGVYGGKLTNSSSSDFQLLVLENGDFYSLYGTNTGSIFGVAGFIQGTGTSANNRFTSSNGKDFGTSPAAEVTTTAEYDPVGKTISGSVSSVRQTSNFSGGPIAGSLYNYNTPATLSTIIGSWSTTAITGERVALTIAANGAFSATSGGGCRFSGAMTPRATGKNVFDVSLTFGAAPCALAGQSGSGIAVAYALTGGRTQLLVAASNATRTNGTAVVGTR